MEHARPDRRAGRPRTDRPAAQATVDQDVTGSAAVVSRKPGLVILAVEGGRAARFSSGSVNVW